MLPSSRRVPRALFKTIVEKGKYSNTEHFSLKRAPSGGQEARIAVSVSKKISKKAVVRNKIRRRAYSALRGIIPSVRPGLYLVSAKPGAGELKSEELKSELKQLFGV